MMHINQLQIKNFRGFEDKVITLNPQFSCAIGDNGMGKSSFLYSVQVALGAYLQCLHLPGVKNRQFKNEERFTKWNAALKEYLPNEEMPLIKVDSEFEGYGNVGWTRIMHNNNTTSHNKRDTGQLIDIVKDLLTGRRSKPISLPVISSFGTDRLNSQIRKGKNAQKRRQRIEKGYLAALEDKVDFNGVIEWLHNYDSEIKYEKEFEGTREAVFEAIMVAIPYLEDLNYNSFYHELEAFVNIDDQQNGKKTHSNMSDGLIAMLNLTAELAYRCVMLNGHFGKNAVKYSKGVVMIDELDMHLHPNWQRHIVSDLKKAFPLIQFIITTHSPFIVQSLSEDELIILDNDIRKDGDPYKKSIEEVSAGEMGVAEIPRSEKFLEQQKVAEEYYRLIEKGKTSDSDENVARLRSRLNELEEMFGEDAAFVAALKIERGSNSL
ncbi:MAG: AAA family ATPase [Taibaiella sp.]|nr:AAA family ATPase [Taibaiella sp.]